MPTTLSSGVALTQVQSCFPLPQKKKEVKYLCFYCIFVFQSQLAGGNSALALAMTVISNMLGILAVSFEISLPFFCSNI